MRLIDGDRFRKEMDDYFPFDKLTQSRHDFWDICKSQMLMILNKQPTVNQWIPITEKLPDLDKYVLATTSWGTITIAERWKDTKGEEKWFVSEGECNAERDDIVAWKPLPEPYKGEADG